MTWYMNFCAPFIPNDPTINFHRYAQVTLLLLYTIAYAILHTYYKFWGPLPLTNEPQAKQSQKQKHDEQSSSENSSQSSEKDKEVSIKIDEQANDSCVEMKKTGTTWDNNTTKTDDIQENVTLGQIESYFPIVFGHFAVAMGLSIMYTPYAEQTIAALLYMLFTIPLLLVNSKRFSKSTNFIWIIMALLLLFILTCGLLQVGQSNWDIINLTCFSNEYVSLYD